MGDHIFISYSWNDRMYVRQLQEAMRSAGLMPWVFEHDQLASQGYVRQLMEVIANAQAILVVLSPASMKSESVQQEVLYAMGIRKQIIPILLQDGEGEVRFLLQPRHWIDARIERFPIGQILATLNLNEGVYVPIVQITALEPYERVVRPSEVMIETLLHARDHLAGDEAQEVKLCTIGTLPEHTIRVEPHIATVSKRHAHITASRQAGGCWVFRLYDTSRNGTSVNSELVHQSAELTNGTLITLARHAVVLRFSLPERTTQEAR